MTSQRNVNDSTTWVFRLIVPIRDTGRGNLAHGPTGRHVAGAHANKLSQRETEDSINSVNKHFSLTSSLPASVPCAMEDPWMKRHTPWSLGSLTDKLTDL